jgi:hypothetical protein
MWPSRRQLQHAHRVFPLLEVLRQAHAPELFEHPRPVERGHAHGDRHAAALGYDGAVDAAAHDQRLFLQRSVGLLHLQHFRPHVERRHFPIEHVAAVLRDEAVEIGLGRVVRRLGPADVLGEALTQHREPDPDGSIRRHAGRRELHLEVGVDVAPLQVRVAHQDGLAGGGPRRTDGPLVRAVDLVFPTGEPTLEAPRTDDPVVMDDTQAVGIDVLGGQRQDRLRLGAQLGSMLAGPLVEAARERLDERGEVGALAHGPLLRRLGQAVGADPLVGVEVVGPVELGAAAARLGVEPHEELGMRLHLCVAVGVEQTGVIGREDVRDAEAVPQDLGAAGTRLGGLRRLYRRRRLTAAGQQTEHEDERRARRSTRADRRADHAARSIRAESSTRTVPCRVL